MHPPSGWNFTSVLVFFLWKASRVEKKDISLLFNLLPIRVVVAIGLSGYHMTENSQRCYYTCFKHLRVFYIHTSSLGIPGLWCLVMAYYFLSRAQHLSYETFTCQQNVIWGMYLEFQNWLNMTEVQLSIHYFYSLSLITVSCTNCWVIFWHCFPRNHLTVPFLFWKLFFVVVFRSKSVIVYSRNSPPSCVPISCSISEVPPSNHVFWAPFFCFFCVSKFFQCIIQGLCDLKKKIQLFMHLC